MTNIFQKTATALATLSPAIPYALDVYLKSDAGDLPATYITYSLIDSTVEQSADNVEKLREYVMQISIYSTAGLASLPNVDAAMIAAGFVKGSERQLPRDAETRHFGLATDYHYYIDL